MNNFYFIYQSYRGPPFEKEVYYLFEYKNGKRIKKKELGEMEVDSGDLSINFNFISINEKKLVLVKSNEEKGIEKVTIINI